MDSKASRKIGSFYDVFKEASQLHSVFDPFCVDCSGCYASGSSATHDYIYFSFSQLTAAAVAKSEERIKLRSLNKLQLSDMSLITSCNLYNF